MLSYALVAINHTAGQGACLPFLTEMENKIFLSARYALFSIFQPNVNETEDSFSGMKILSNGFGGKIEIRPELIRLQLPEDGAVHRGAIKGRD